MALSSDPNTIICTYALHEEPVGEETSTQVEMCDNGRVVGQTLPANNHVKVFLFKGVSGKEGYLPLLTETDTRRVLDKFNNGGELRVYRNFPVDLTAWTMPDNLAAGAAYHNSDGYSDITPCEIREASYGWFDNVMMRFEFTIEGTEVR